MTNSSEILDKESEKNKPKKESGGFGWLSLLISAFFIVRGIMLINENRATWGTIMLIVGVGGLAIKLWDIYRNK